MSASPEKGSRCCPFLFERFPPLLGPLFLRGGVPPGSPGSCCGSPPRNPLAGPFLATPFRGNQTPRVPSPGGPNPRDRLLPRAQPESPDHLVIPNLQSKRSPKDQPRIGEKFIDCPSPISLSWPPHVARVSPGRKGHDDLTSSPPSSSLRRQSD